MPLPTESTQTRTGSSDVVTFSAPLEQFHQELTASVRGLTVEQTQSRPKGRPDAWSIQQIVQHLMLTYDMACVAFEERLAKARPSHRPVTLKERVVQRVVLNWGWFPNGRSAPEFVRPEQISLPPLDGAELATEATRHLAAFDAIARRAEAAFGSGRCINHAILGMMSVAQWRRFQVVHGRHHLKQIAGIRAEQEAAKGAHHR